MIIKFMAIFFGLFIGGANFYGFKKIHGDKFSGLFICGAHFLHLFCSVHKKSCTFGKNCCNILPTQIQKQTMKCGTCPY